MKLPGCGGSSIGCLIVGLILGALLVWLAIPRLTRKGYTPDRAAERIEGELETISGFAEEGARKVSDGAEKVKEIRTLIEVAGGAEEPAPAVAPEIPPEPSTVIPQQR